jgi:hypothetical protein
VRFTWKGKWREGEIAIESESLKELENLLDKLFSSREEKTTSQTNSEDFPTLQPGLGCVDAIRALLQTKWGKLPRTMIEIKDVLEANAAYFTKGTLSGTLTLMTKRGELRRFRKDGKWVYVSK